MPPRVAIIRALAWRNIWSTGALTPATSRRIGVARVAMTLRRIGRNKVGVGYIPVCFRVVQANAVVIRDVGAQFCETPVAIERSSR